MTNRCFCYIRGEYEFTVLPLLSDAIKYISPKITKENESCGNIKIHKYFHLFVIITF